MQNDKLYAVALQCVRLNNAGCAGDCTGCQFNVFNYVSDIREASLLKANAYTDFYKQNAIMERVANEKSAHTVAPLIFLIGFIAIIGWCLSSIKTCFTPQPTQTLSSVTQPENPSAIFFVFANEAERRRTVLPLNEEIEYFLVNQNKLENIPRIIKIIETYGVDDWNDDGKVNCIDYTLMFRQFYGSDAHMIANHNHAKNFHHLFIRIYHDNGSRTVDIEPQGMLHNYRMLDYWGDRYDPKFNIDLTHKYTQFIYEL